MRCHAMQYTLLLVHTRLLGPDRVHALTSSVERGQSTMRREGGWQLDDWKMDFG